MFQFQHGHSYITLSVNSPDSDKLLFKKGYYSAHPVNRPIIRLHIPANKAFYLTKIANLLQVKLIWQESGKSMYSK